MRLKDAGDERGVGGGGLRRQGIFKVRGHGPSPAGRINASDRHNPEQFVWGPVPNEDTLVEGQQRAEPDPMDFGPVGTELQAEGHLPPQNYSLYFTCLDRIIHAMARLIVASLSAIAAVIAAPVTHAQEGNCRAIKDNAERLACYDRPAPEAAAPKTGEWYASERVSDLDRKKILFISLNATKSGIARYSSKTVFARLIIACGEGKTILHIDFKSDVAYGLKPVSVQYRVGSNKPQVADWSASQDHEAYGPFSGPSTIPLIKQMLDADEFYVRGSDSVIGTSDALFKIEGIAEAIKPIRAACKW